MRLKKCHKKCPLVYTQYRSQNAASSFRLLAKYKKNKNEQLIAYQERVVSKLDPPYEAHAKFMWFVSW